MLLTGTYVLNLLCAIVPCHANRRPTGAHISNQFFTRGNVTDISAVVGIPPLENNTLDPVKEFQSEDALTSNVLLGGRSKRLYDGVPSNTTNVRSLRRSQYPNLVNPLRTLMNAFQKGMEQSGGYMHNFGNQLVPYPEAVPGNVKRNVQTQSKVNERMVFLRNGDAVEGYYMGTMEGKRIMAFQGIPYGEPPVGNLRFRPPVPKRPWRGLLKTYRPGSECLQGHPVNVFRISGSEDCLYLNVYTNQTSSSQSKGELLPVIFFIHGGSFMYGSGAEYGPSYIVDKGVVLVTINYRLGALGFMSTLDKHSSGNYGLKDQALALKWTYENIEQFGGDKNRITIMGQSAGSVSAHIHLIANKTTHLFQNGVGLSGSAFGFWPLVQKQRALGFTRRLAKNLRCPFEDSEKLVKCLRSVRANYIIGAQLHFFTWIAFHPLIVFGPVVEPDIPEAYLTKTPEELYKNGLVPKKPWIFGQTSQEGHFETYMISLFFQTPILKTRLKDLLPVVLDYREFINEPTQSKVTQQVMEFYGAEKYLGIGQDSSKLMNVVSDMYTDRIFTNGIQKSIRSHGLIAPTYAYIFDYMGRYNLGQVFGAARSEWGVVHTEDLFYFFNSSVFHDGFRRDEPEYKMSEIMTNLIANFARNGEPLYTSKEGGDVQVWNSAINQTIPITSELQNTRKKPKDLPINYLRFSETIEMIRDPFLERVQFWKSLGIRL